MDRLLKITSPVRIKLSENCSGRTSAEAGFQLLPQLSTSVWAYYREKDQLCLVTRSSTLVTRLERSGNESSLIVEEVAATNPQDVTAAFRDGCKIVAEWVEAGPANAAHCGAADLCAHLTGIQTDSPNDPRNLAAAEGPRITGDPTYFTAQTSIPNPPERERPATNASAGPAANAPGPILPQSEIDHLVQSLLAGQQGAAPGVPGSTGQKDAPDLMPPFTAQMPPLQEKAPEPPQRDSERLPALEINPAGSAWVDSPPQSSSSIPAFGCPGTEEETPRPPQEAIPPQATPPPAATPPSPPSLDGAGTGICLDDWTDTRFAASAVEQTKHLQDGLSTEESALLEILPSSQPYIVVIFANKQIFQHQLPALCDGFSGGILALWAGETVYSRLSQSHLNNLRDLQAKYRSAAAALQKEITRLRQLEQMLPNLQNYRHQQEVVAGEIVKISEEIHNLRLKQIFQTNEGRILARRIYDVDSRRYKILDRLATDSYKMLRRAAPSVMSRSRYARTRARFLNNQRLLEECFERLARLEKEIQRRLEYQSDYQNLVKRQAIKERELEEIKRFIQSIATYSPGGTAGDPESMAKWLKTSWEHTKKLELLLQDWQETLTEERAWASRRESDPLLVLADPSALALPAIVRGAFVILIAEEQTEAMAQAFVGCSEWLMLGLDLKTIGAGKGVTPTTSPVFSVVAELAGKVKIEFEEALRALHLIDLADGFVPEEPAGGENNV